MSSDAYLVADKIIEELNSRDRFSDWWHTVPIGTRVSIVERMVDIIEYYGVIRYASSENKNE